MSGGTFEQHCVARGCRGLACFGMCRCGTYDWACEQHLDLIGFRRADHHASGVAAEGLAPKVSGSSAVPAAKPAQGSLWG